MLPVFLELLDPLSTRLGLGRHEVGRPTTWCDAHLIPERTAGAVGSEACGAFSALDAGSLYALPVVESNSTPESFLGHTRLIPVTTDRMPTMAEHLFNLTKGSLYRSPLKLVEDDQKRSHDLGYHHAKRGQAPDPQGAVDQEAYQQGYESGRKHRVVSQDLVQKMQGKRGLRIASRTEPYEDGVRRFEAYVTPTFSKDKSGQTGAWRVSRMVYVDPPRKLVTKVAGKRQSLNYHPFDHISHDTAENAVHDGVKWVGDVDHHEVHEDWFRSPLKLVEAMEGDQKRAWDLGYHHAIRGQRFMDGEAARGLSDKESYKGGYEAGKGTHASARREPREEGDQVWDAFGRRHGEMPWWLKMGAHGSKSARYEFGDDLHEAVYKGLRTLGIKHGERLGTGGTGAVFPHRDDPSKVTKIELGDNEARIARFVMNNDALKNNRALPNFTSVTDTGVRHMYDYKMEPHHSMHAMQREELQDTHLTDPAPWRGYFHSLGRAANSEVADRSNIGYLVDGVNREYEQLIHPEDRGQFDQFSEDIKSMSQQGIMPRDMSVTFRSGQFSNLGIRASTGDLVVRDLGMYRVIRDPSSPRPPLAPSTV